MKLTPWYMFNNGHRRSLWSSVKCNHGPASTHRRLLLLPHVYQTCPEIPSTNDVCITNFQGRIQKFAEQVYLC